MQYIERKSMLYKTGVEYGDYTMNHVQGCSHGCKYPCYAFLMAKRFGRVHCPDCWNIILHGASNINKTHHFPPFQIHLNF